jgi:hypothetical protein
MKPFETTQGPKQEVRNLICNHAELHLGTNNIKKIFTLPSKEALCYYNFKERFPKASIKCIEYKEEIVKILHNKDIECQHINIKDYAKNIINLERHHDIIFLDYYSFLSKNILDEISAFITNDNIIHPNKTSIIGITLMKAMRQDKNETLELLSDYRYKGDRKGTKNEVAQIAEGLENFLDVNFNLSNIEELEAIEYKADKKSTSMYFILLKVTK